MKASSVDEAPHCCQRLTTRTHGADHFLCAEHLASVAQLASASCPLCHFADTPSQQLRAHFDALAQDESDLRAAIDTREAALSALKLEVATVSASLQALRDKRSTLRLQTQIARRGLEAATAAEAAASAGILRAPFERDHAASRVAAVGFLLLSTDTPSALLETATATLESDLSTGADVLPHVRDDLERLCASLFEALPTMAPSSASAGLKTLTLLSQRAFEILPPPPLFVCRILPFLQSINATISTAAAEMLVALSGRSAAEFVDAVCANKGEFAVVNFLRRSNSLSELAVSLALELTTMLLQSAKTREAALLCDVISTLFLTLRADPPPHLSLKCLFALRLAVEDPAGEELFAAQPDATDVIWRAYVALSSCHQTAQECTAMKSSTAALLAVGTQSQPLPLLFLSTDRKVIVAACGWLEDADLVTRRSAVALLRRIARDQKAREMVPPDVVPRLAAFVGDVGTPCASEIALETLFHVSAVAEFRREIVKCAIMPTLVSSARAANESLRFWAMGVIRNVAAASDKALGEAIACGAAAAAVEMMSSERVRDVEMALGALGVFVQKQVPFEPAFWRDALPRAVALLHFKEASVCECAAALLAALCSNEDVRTALRERGLFASMILALASEEANDVAVDTSVALWLCARDVKNKTPLCDAGIVPVIVSILLAHRDAVGSGDESPKWVFLENICGLALSLTAVPSVRQKFIEADGVKLLADFSAAENEFVAENAGVVGCMTF